MPRLRPLRAMLMSCLAVVLLAAVTAMPAAPAEAGSKRYAISRSDLARVGRLDRKLTAACRRHRFNQERDLRLYIGYIGPRGRGTTGVAKKGWNLRDPLNLARRGETYHFKNDGFSNCRVYVARGRGRR